MRRLSQDALTRVHQLIRDVATNPQESWTADKIAKVWCNVTALHEKLWVMGFSTEIKLM